MLEVLDGFPDHVLAVEGKGEITAEDYSTVLVPEVDARIARHGSVRLLYKLGPEYAGFSPGAAWSDTKLGVSHWTKFGRIALVTDVTWLREATRMFAPFFHHPIRIFANAEMDEARTWITAAGD